MIVREYIDIKRGIDVQPALNIGDRRRDVSRGSMIINLLNTFHFLEYRSMKGFDERTEKEMEITLESGLKHFEPRKVIKELKKWFKDFTNYIVDIDVQRTQGINQFKINVFSG